jgi:hypothetical protein
VRGAILVPYAALRWQPKVEWVVRDARAKVQQAAEASIGQRGSRNLRANRCVWVLEDGLARPIHAQTRLSDGTATEIVGGDL